MEKERKRVRQPVCFRQCLITAAGLFAFVFLLSGIGLASTAPQWVKTASASPIKPYDKSINYVVLLDEQATTVGSGGGAETRFRYVIKLLSREGRSAARRDVYYDQETTISAMRAWHIRPDGRVVKLEKDQIADQTLTDDLYSNSKTKLMRFPDADAGSIVAFEWAQKVRPSVNQDYHYFQQRSPVVVSRYRLKLPNEWTVDPFVFNHPPISPSVEGNTYTWELHDLEPILDEPRMPELTSVAPCLDISYFPSHGKVAKRSFSSWQDVSRWASRIMDRQSDPGPGVETKARSLVANTRSQMDKIGSVATWVQKEIRYVSIQLGAKGGYQPHNPSLVLSKGYGDCKDKASLLEAMLRGLGVSAYTVLVYSGDPTRVRPEFPSVLQFNHAIVAIATSTGVETAGQTNRVGDLLFFDPTDGLTPFGDLPYYLQGSYGLVVKAGAGELVQLPEAPATNNALRRDVTATLDASGGIVADIRESLTGQKAAMSRSQSVSAEPKDFAKEIAALATRGMAGCMVSQIEADDDPKTDLAFAFRLRSQGFASMSGNLMIIRPGLFWADSNLPFDAAIRRQPVVFDMKSIQFETVTINVPQGERIDEIPANTKMKTDFGEFVQTYRVAGNQIVVDRRMEISARLVPVNGYQQVKRFFDSVRSASDASLVLVRG
jgi:transglutaminase-like putative cysteine protease